MKYFFKKGTAKDKKIKEKEFYDIRDLMNLCPEAIYYVVFGQRSNGKTYSALDYVLDKAVKKREEFAYIRRFDDEIKGHKGSQVFDAFVNNGSISKKTNGQFDGIKYQNRKWYFSRYSDAVDKVVRDENPIGHAFSLSTAESYKSTSFSNITTIIFDEFITRGLYLPDEFIAFQNLISTIRRRRTNVKIIMLGNSINKYNPYFKEMGLTGVAKMEQGDVQFYKYGENDNYTVALNYTYNKLEDKEVDRYYCFDNPKLKMITDGEWELEIVPHLPEKYKPKDIKYRYYIEYEGETLQCEIIKGKEGYFTYIHRKTSEIKRDKNEIIFSRDRLVSPYHRTNIMKPYDKMGKVIADFFYKEKVFYQDNEIGNIVSNFISNSI